MFSQHYFLKFLSHIFVADYSGTRLRFRQRQAMARKATHISFGAFLRESRKRRGLTLTEVALASRDIARHPSGSISHPHLSQIENGRPIAVTLPKVLTLSALYMLFPHQIIDQAPDALRTALNAALAEWESEGKPQPLFVRYLPRVVREVDGEIDRLLEPLAQSVSIPLGDEIRARWRIRQGLVPVVMPLFVHANPKIARDFWNVDAAEEALPWRPPTKWWHVLVSEFTDWILYEKRAFPDALGIIESWTIDFSSGVEGSEGTELISCSFKDRTLNTVYSFRDAPIAAVRAIRWRQTARLLRSSIPNGSWAIREAPDSPDPVDGLLDYFARLITPLHVSPVTKPGNTPAELVKLFLELRKAIPTLKTDAPVANQSLIRSLASLVDRANEPS